MVISQQVDGDFLALPLDAVTDSAISTAKALGASHVDVRIERIRTGILSIRTIQYVDGKSGLLKLRIVAALT
jgi:TldD protein